MNLRILLRQTLKALPRVFLMAFSRMGRRSQITARRVLVLMAMFRESLERKELSGRFSGSYLRIWI